MNIRELYVLNRALDGEDIAYIPSFKKLGISEFMVSAIKDGMIERGLLKSYGEFTDDGVRITDRIRRYKEAKKHIRIDNLMIGVVDSNESILILWNPLLNEYSVRVIDTSMGTAQIIESYEFLADNTNEAGDDKEELSYDELQKRFDLNSDNSFRISSLTNGEKSDEIYFRSESGLYVFNCLTNVLYAKNKKDILDNLDKRMQEWS